MFLNLAVHYLIVGVLLLVFGTIGAIRTKEHFSFSASLIIVSSWPIIWIWSFKNKRERSMITLFTLISNALAFWIRSI